VVLDNKKLPEPGELTKADALASSLLREFRGLIETARQRAAQAVSAELVLLYWRIGARLRTEILGGERAQYGEAIVSTLSRQLSADYGAGFSRQNLFHMVRFAEAWPDESKVVQLAEQLGWSHIKEILYLQDPLQREFYGEMCRLERWSVRTLRERVKGMLYERTAISRKPEATIRNALETLHREDRLTPDLVFRDPYLLDFLGLADTYSERDLEAAILRELEHFLLELGTDFTFVARQKRLTIGDEDFYLDLLFYHRGLRRLVAIDLKLGRFEAAYKGQMELYLRWLDKHERHPETEESPIGLILCSTKDEEQIELLQLTQGEIRVAEYWTALPSRERLKHKLHEAVRRAREKLAPKSEASD
jgi:predicted nuclease of restriction endonuclease-like (RecB) superfamily